MKLQTIEYSLEKEPDLLYKYDYILKRVINHDFTGVNDEVKKGYIKVIYMGFCDCCMSTPCIKLSSHRLYNEYKEKYKKLYKEPWNVDYIIYDNIEYTNIKLAVEKYIKTLK
jgi:hypothetical protein